VARLSWEQVCSFRVRRQQLHERAPAARMLEVAARIGGLHAQVLSSAELTLWARVEGLSRTAVRDALWRDRTLVKIWAMRGTLHLVPSSEYGLWQAALSNYKHYLQPAWLRRFGMTARLHERLARAVEAALKGEVLTRAELATAVFRHTKSAAMREWVLQSWGSMLKPAAYQGRLCFGPSAGQNVRFAGPSSWLGPYEAGDPEEALREMGRRFLAAHGPAARNDLARYWHLTSKQAGTLIEACGAEPLDVEGEPMWMLPQDLKEASRGKPARSVRLLPAFDQYVIGASRHAEKLMPGPFRARVYRQQGWLSPVLLVDGRMEGVWRGERKGKTLSVRIEPFRKLPPAVRRAAELEAKRLADHVGAELRLEGVT
jgi:uncharacterized protein YcaQ